jgi:type VI secretion system protein ImpK
MGAQPSQAVAPPRRRDTLALLYENAFTVIVRVRSNRQAVTNAESFRANMRAMLKKAQQEAIQKGYSPEDAGLAVFAVVAFLDESVLSSNNPAFADWSRRPLQEELFQKGHVAGEAFFQQLDRLLGRRHSEELADLLEVYYLCLLLGYKGRYSVSEPAAIREIKGTVGEKIAQIRGPASPISPSAVPVDSVAPGRSDPWIRRLVWASVASLLLALALFVVFKLQLSAGVSNLAQVLSR